MGKLSVFNFMTLNGFYKGPHDDIAWHRHGGEEAKFSEEGLRQDNILLLGRKTYEVMVSFWPTQAATEAFPEVADGMNNAEKIVFSRSLKKAEWKNTRVVAKNIADEVRKIKKSSRGKDMTILGSGSIVSQLADEGLIDEYLIMVDPVAIGDGTPLLNGIRKKLDLRLTSTKTFSSGIVLLVYSPM